MPLKVIQSHRFNWYQWKAHMQLKLSILYVSKLLLIIGQIFVGYVSLTLKLTATKFNVKKLDNAFRFLIPFCLGVSHESDGPTDRENGLQQ